LYLIRYNGVEDRGRVTLGRTLKASSRGVPGE
jgi:hypothetical protein